jgi:hypothetical protein
MQSDGGMNDYKEVGDGSRAHEPFELQEERRLLQGASWPFRIAVAVLVAAAALVFWWAGRATSSPPSLAHTVGVAGARSSGAR